MDTLLNSSKKIGDDPILRARFIESLLAAPIYAPVMDSEEAQAQNGGVSLMATPVDGVQHVLIFSNEDNMKGFVTTGTRFAKVTGAELFPLLAGNHAILNPGKKGLKLDPTDIAEILGDTQNGSCQTPGHVHGPDCRHD